MFLFLIIQRILLNDLGQAEISDYYSNEAKFIFIGLNAKEADLRRATSYFFTMKILNVLVIGTSGGTVKAYSFNPFRNLKNLSMVYLIDLNSTTIEKVYPDKLLDLYGYGYVAVIYTNPPRSGITNGILYSEDHIFMLTVAERQNAHLRIFMQKNTSEINQILNNGQVDIVLYTRTFTVEQEHKMYFVNTFENDGLCALIPLPLIKSSFAFMFEPFDLWTWLLIIVTMLFCAIVWHFLKKISPIDSNTAGYFIFGYIASFFGQLIPFRQHSRKQKLVMQLTILLTFILGNAYQSVMISMISDARYGNKITTINEMVQGNYSFYANSFFDYMLNGSELYLQIKPRVIDYWKSHNYRKFASENIAIIETCSLIDYLLEKRPVMVSEKQEDLIDFYYKLDEKLTTYSLEYPIEPKSFFRDRLNQFSLRILESGIKTHWKEKIPTENIKALRQRQYYENEEYLLKITDLTPAFYLLAFGLILSAITFVFEIFWHDFLSRLNWKGLKNGFQKSLTKTNNPKDRQASRCQYRVGFIQVRPSNRSRDELILETQV